MSYPLYHIMRWHDGDKAEEMDEDELFERIPDCESVGKYDYDDLDLGKSVKESLDGDIDGVRTERIDGEQGVKLIVPKGEIAKYLQRMLDNAKRVINDRNLENQLLNDLAHDRGIAWELGEIFQNSYMHTLWLDDGWDYSPCDTIRFFGRFVEDNYESDTAFRVVGLYYHK